MENKKFKSFEQWSKTLLPNRVKHEKYVKEHFDDSKVAEILASKSIRDIIDKLDS